MSFPTTIAEAARQLRAGTVSSVDLVEACLARIAALEPQVRAWVLVDEAGARRAAAEADKELQSGIDRGSLHGIPIGVKDIIDLAGRPTLAGSRVRPPVAAERNALVVDKLLAAGVVVLGKTVTTEFASFDPPPTRNPWNFERTPGGSSSGSAAASAVGMCFAALGSQTGGSVIRPASYCGVAGIKPTYGRLGLSGIVPLAYHLDHPGVLARTVDDLAVTYRAMQGVDHADPCFVRNLTETDRRPFVAGRDDAQAPASLRLGLVRGYFHEFASDDVRTGIARAVERLRSAGAVVREIKLPESFVGVPAAHRIIMAVDAAAYHREVFAARRAEYGPRVASLLDEGLAASAVDYAQALHLQRRFRREMEALLAAADVDSLIMPAVGNTAPPRETTGDVRFQAPWSLAGLPVVSLPCDVASDGLPVAIQCVGQAWCEDSLLRTAAACERAIAFTARPPIAV
ncbi:MAG: amidase [Planctomycetia bacterium]|nr:amidase [Planctomycetia bacterium]